MAAAANPWQRCNARWSAATRESSKVTHDTSQFDYSEHLIVYFDLETTDKDPHTTEIIDIAAAVEPGCTQIIQNSTSLSDTFESLVRPQGDIHPGATAVHGISNGDVQKATAFKGVGGQLVEWLQAWCAQWCKAPKQRVLLVAHNSFGFDMLILQRQLAVSGLKLPEAVAFGDSLLAARECFHRSQVPSFALERLAILWVPEEKRKGKQQHRAMPDVQLLMCVVQHCPAMAEVLSTMVRLMRAAC